MFCLFAGSSFSGGGVAFVILFTTDCSCIPQLTEEEKIAADLLCL